MKLFVIWAADATELKPLFDGLKKENHELLYWVGSSRVTKEDVPEGVMFQRHVDAWDAKPAVGVDTSSFAPPSVDRIKELSKTETLMLTMMNKRFGYDCVDKRRMRYYKMLQYWTGVLEQYKPDAIIFPTVPHTVYNYLIYVLAKEQGIKTIMFEDSWVTDRLLTYSDWREGSRALVEQIKATADADVSVSDLSDDLQAYYTKQTDPTEDSTPVYMTHWKKKFGKLPQLLTLGKRFAKSLTDGSVFKRIPQYISRKRQPNLKKEYEPLAVSPDLSTKFVYVPLNFQPERTTCPQGDVYVDQILMIKTLAAGLPEGWKIYVKEHPSQWWLRSGTAYSCDRYPGYYEQIAAIPGVSLVPISTNSFTLTEKASAVATVTGTAGWEAILRKTPTLIFGYPWYRDFPSLFRITSAKDVEASLKKIDDGFRVEEQDILRFLKAFDHATVNAYIEGFVDRISKIDRQESLARVTDIILRHLKSA